MKTLFTAEQFTSTLWDTTEEKLRFAEHFVRFVEGGFRQTVFPKWFYHRLSNTFYHIPHYDRAAFWGTWFSSTQRQLDFLVHTANHRTGGDPKYGYSDVEQVLSQWVREQGLVEKYQLLVTQAVEAKERAELARLIAKYGIPEEE